MAKVLWVIAINKDGGRIKSYTCSDGYREDIVVSKDKMIKIIQSNRVGNAKLQIYKGKPIIRVMEASQGFGEKKSKKQVQKQSAVMKAKKAINTCFDILQKVPKPQSSKIGGTYYGSTELISSRGNMLELMKCQSYTDYDSYCGIRTYYPDIYAVKMGGAYSSTEAWEIFKRLGVVLKEMKPELRDEGWVVLDKYGTNFCTCGIVKSQD